MTGNGAGNGCGLTVQPQPWADVRRHAHEAVATLPERDRVLIGLAYWDGLSPSEIAVRTGLDPGTITTRIRSALARLADSLEEDGLL